MASSKIMASSKPKYSDLTSSSSSTTTDRSRRLSSSSPSDYSNNNNKTFTSLAASQFTSKIPMTTTTSTTTTITTSTTDSTLLDAQITLIDNPTTPPPPPPPPQLDTNSYGNSKTVDEVWREIVSGRKEIMKEEQPDEMMTLEDFLAKAGAVVVDDDHQNDAHVDAAADDIKMPLPLPLSTSTSGGGVVGGGAIYFDNYNTGDTTPHQQSNAFQMLDKVEGSIVAFGNGGSGGVIGRGKRGRNVVMEPLDKAAQQRQRRMIKNRESAARSRERKQAYQVELESLAVRLEVENEQLIKDKEERTKERFKQLMENVVPVVEKRRPPRMLRRVSSMQW